MTKINLKKTRWIKFFYEIQKEFDLSAQQTLIYGYLYNHCKNLRDDGWCGYSDERMSKELNISYERFRKELYILRKKELIIIKNPGKRTKKAGQSRMIYINTSVFLEEEQLTLTDIELENARKEIERLKGQVDSLLKELQMAKRNYANAYTLRIAYAGVVPEEQLDDMHRMLAPVYEAMANEFTFKQIMSHIDYVINQIKRREVSKPITYILSSAQHFKPDVQKVEEIDKTFHTLPKEVFELDIDDDDPFA